jgi:hypothetical protein
MNRKTLSFAATCLLLAVASPANAAKLLGIDFAPLDPPGTAKILAFDTALGTSVVVADTGFKRDGSNGNGTFGPNGLAYDAAKGVAYFAAIPNTGARTRHSVVIDPQQSGAVKNLGLLAGTPFDADFFAGHYWYVDSATDDLRRVSFNPDGTIALDTKRGDLKGNASGFGFGDVAINKDGLLFGSADIIGGPNNGQVVLFTVDLTNADPASTYTELSIASTSLNPKMQLSFGGDGTLFGHAAGGGATSILYYVSVVPGQVGARAEVLKDIEGGPFTALASFNPLCDCARACEQCSGQVNQLRLLNNGPAASITVRQQDNTVVFSSFVESGASFSFQGTGVKNKLGPKIYVVVGNVETEVHTSCSIAIGPGSTFGNFKVLSGTSADNNALLCPIGKSCPN